MPKDKKQATARQNTVAKLFEQIFKNNDTCDLPGLVQIGSNNVSNYKSGILAMYGPGNKTHLKNIQLEIVSGENSSITTKNKEYYIEASEEGGSFMLNGVKIDILSDGSWSVHIEPPNCVQQSIGEANTLVIGKLKFHFSKKGKHTLKKVIAKISGSGTFIQEF
jgi:hypothetical protein